MMDWYYQTRYWISKPPAKVLAVLILLAIVSFVPALLTDLHDLQITEGGDFIIQDLPINEHGVGPTYSNATSRNG